jgi:predicted N-acetyltransferase YhbS
MSQIALSIEPARLEDAEAIEKLHARAFGPGRFARTAFRVREQAKTVHASGFVARVGSFLVGSVLLTPVHVGGVQALMLGPLTVEPAFEGRGIGAALLQRSADEAKALGAALILLVGDEAYYKRHGYKRVPMGQITLPGPVDPSRLLALEIAPEALATTRGEVKGV